MLQRGKQFYSLFLCILLPVLFCSKYPGAPDYKGLGDCGRPTVPSGLFFKDSAALQKEMATDSMIISPPKAVYYEEYVYIEMYDYEKNMISGTLSGPIKTMNKMIDIATPIDIYWSGTDSKGNKVENGRYVMKMSFITKYDTVCKCGDAFLTTN
jgi:hypothetical protein